MFLPEKYKCFSYTDLSIPLESGEFMLTPYCEGKIMQAMDFNLNDNVLIVGTGSGYLTECISHLTNTVSSYEIDLELFHPECHGIYMWVSAYQYYSFHDYIYLCVTIIV